MSETVLYPLSIPKVVASGKGQEIIDHIFKVGGLYLSLVGDGKTFTNCDDGEVVYVTISKQWLDSMVSKEGVDVVDEAINLMFSTGSYIFHKVLISAVEELDAKGVNREDLHEVQEALGKLLGSEENLNKILNMGGDENDS